MNPTSLFNYRVREYMKQQGDIENVCTSHHQRAIMF